MKALLRWLLPAVVLWLTFSWPLPKHLFSGIPSSAHNVEKGQARSMIAGDHLQLMYHFWLAGDMIRGQTPLFHNLYEFNFGHDDERVERGSYFMPFPIIYAVGDLLGGRAFGWNLTAFVSLWFTYVLTLLLARRYTRDSAVAVTAALVSIAFPYRWVTVLGGSPTGPALAWIPLLFLGLDMAVRDERARGGWLAGIAVLFACWGDTHVFFFSVLAVPCWCIIAFLARERFEWRRPAAYRRIITALSPLLVFAAATMVYIHMISRDLAGSKASGGRALAEVAAFSPRPAGVFMWGTEGVSAHAYVGWVIVVVIAVGWVFLTGSCGKRFRDCWRRWSVLTALIVGVTGIVFLALGPHGPFGGKLFSACRRLIPPYAMVRQTGKIYCLLPTFLAVAAALALGSVPGRGGARRSLCVGLIALLILAEYRGRISPTISLVEKTQSAYGAVAEGAASRGEKPRGLAVPLWPGDSHWSSLYQYYASLYRIRMVNGYRPFVPKDYVDNVFSRFDSVNMGSLTDEQLDELAGRGIRYVLVHEDAFPERVSSYPVGLTLKRFLNHPRLSLLRQDSSVWAFEILDAARQRPERASAWKMFSPSRLWEMERSRSENVDPAHDETASGAGYVSISCAGAFVETRLTRTVDAPDQRWMIRARGQGTIVCDVLIDHEIKQQADLTVDSPIWVWKELLLPRLNGYPTVSLRLNWRHGATDLDMVLLAAGEWQDLAEGQSLVLPAPCFFHAGYTNLRRDTVTLQKDRDPNDAIFYGPNMPMAPGEYEVSLGYSSLAAQGTVLGHLSARSGQTTFGPFDVIVGRKARADLLLKHNLPLRLDFVFARNADVEIKGVTFRRLR